MSTSAVVSRRRAIKRIFVTTNLERLRLGTSFLFREIARIGKTRAGKKEEQRRKKKKEGVREKEREGVIYRSRSIADEKRGDTSGENYTRSSRLFERSPEYLSYVYKCHV